MRATPPSGNICNLTKLNFSFKFNSKLFLQSPTRLVLAIKDFQLESLFGSVSLYIPSKEKKGGKFPVK